MRSHLEEYRFGLLEDEVDHLYCGADIISGLSFSVNDSIVNESNVVMPFQSFRQRYGFPSHAMATDVWGIVCTTLGRDPANAIGEHGSQLEYDMDDSEPSDDESEYQRPTLWSDSDCD